MSYLLTVLSSGRREYLDRTLASFVAMVSPEPAAVYVYDDGGTIPLEAFAPLQDLAIGAGLVTVESASKRIGMCAAHAHCWRAAAESSTISAFHIEDDMVFLRPTNLDRIAARLGREPHLAQMTLLRCPWGAEVQYGGYIPQTPGWYERCSSRGDEWIQTTRNWANAPTLFRTELARRVDWPAEPGCETTIGPRLLADDPDVRFGIWGAGEPWCAHVGIDRAPGSHGY